MSGAGAAASAVGSAVTAQTGSQAAGKLASRAADSVLSGNKSTRPQSAQPAQAGASSGPAGTQQGAKKPRNLIGTGN